VVRIATEYPQLFVCRFSFELAPGESSSSIGGSLLAKYKHALNHIPPEQWETVWFEIQTYANEWKTLALNRLIIRRDEIADNRNGGITEHIQLRVRGVAHLLDSQYTKDWLANFSADAIHAYFANKDVSHDMYFRTVARMRLMSATPHEVLCMGKLPQTNHAGYQRIANNEWIRCYDWEIDQICMKDVQTTPLVESLTTTTDAQLRVLQHKLFHVQNDVSAPPFKPTLHAAVELHDDVVDKRVHACVECGKIQTMMTVKVTNNANLAIKTIFKQEHVKWDWEEKFKSGAIYDIVRFASLYEQFKSNVKHATNLHTYLESGRRFRLAILTSGKDLVKHVQVKVIVRVMTTPSKITFGPDDNYTQGEYTALFEQDETHVDVLMAIKTSLDFLASDYVDKFDDLELGKPPGCACQSQTLYHTPTCPTNRFSRFVRQIARPDNFPPPLIVRGGFHSTSTGLPPLATFQDEKGHYCRTLCTPVPLGERDKFTFVFRVYHAPDVRRGLLDTNNILFSQSLAMVGGNVVKLISGPPPGSGSTVYEAKLLTESDNSLSVFLRKLRMVVKDASPPRIILVALLHVPGLASHATLKGTPHNLGPNVEHFTDMWRRQFQMIIDIVGDDAWYNWLEQVANVCVNSHARIVDVRTEIYTSKFLPKAFVVVAKNILGVLSTINLEDRLVQLDEITFLHPVEYSDEYAIAADGGFSPAMLAIGTANSMQKGTGMDSFEAAAEQGNVVAFKLAAEEIAAKLKSIDVGDAFAEGDPRAQWPDQLESWLRRSADVGDAYAQFCIGLWHVKSSRTTVGIDYLSRAAAQGYREAIDALAAMRPPAAWLSTASDVRQLAIKRGAIFSKSNPKSPDVAIALTVRALRSAYPEACATDADALKYVVSAADVPGKTTQEESFAETMRQHVLQIVSDSELNSLFSGSGQSPRTISLEGATAEQVSVFLERIGAFKILTKESIYSITQLNRKFALKLKDRNTNLDPRPYRSELFSRSAIPNVVYDYACGQCGGAAADLECAGCFLVHYCCDGCQRQHWKEGHNKTCEVMLRDGWTVWNAKANQLVEENGVITEMYDPFEMDKTATNFYVRVNWRPKSSRTPTVAVTGYAGGLADSYRDGVDATMAVKWKKPKSRGVDKKRNAVEAKLAEMKQRLADNKQTLAEERKLALEAARRTSALQTLHDRLISPIAPSNSASLLNNPPASGGSPSHFDSLERQKPAPVLPSAVHPVKPNPIEPIGGFRYDAFEYGDDDIDIPSSQEIIKIKLPPGIIGIGANVFAKLTRLKMVTLDGTRVAFVGDNAFAGSANLGLFVGCNALRTIGESAFRDCGQLITAGIVPSVCTIEPNAFRNCWKLTDLEGRFAQIHPGIINNGIHPWRSIASCRIASGDVKQGNLLELVDYDSQNNMYTIYNHEQKWDWSTPTELHQISGDKVTVLDASHEGAFNIYLDAAGYDHPTACVVLGMLADETNVGLSASEIARLAYKRNPVWWYAKAAAASQPIGVQHLAREFHNAGDSRELMWVVRGAELNDAVCAHTLGMYYSTGWASDFGSKALLKLKHLPFVEPGAVPCHVYLSTNISVKPGASNTFPGTQTPLAVFEIPAEGAYLGPLISDILDDLAAYDVLIPIGKFDWQLVDVKERDLIWIDPAKLEKTTGLKSFPVWINFQLPCSLRSVGQGCSFGTDDPASKASLDKDVEKAKKFLLQSANTGHEPALLDYTKLFGPPTVPNEFPLLTSIGQKAFAHCEQLASLDLSGCDSLFILPHSAFAFCGALEHFAFPPHLREIGPNCFNNSAVRSFTVNAELRTIGKDAFRESKLHAIDFTQADNLTQIEKRAFDKCTYLAKITFDTQATDRPLMTLDKATFRGCTSLISTELPMNVHELPPELFSGCTSLATIELGGTTKIKKHAFRGCRALRTVVHFSVLESLDEDAFYEVGARPEVQFKHDRD
jgi:hypothetical protein